MEDMVTIEIAVPQKLLTAVDEQRQVLGESASQFFCRGAETLLRRHKERRMLEQFVEARTKMPDSEEVNEARRALNGDSD